MHIYVAHGFLNEALAISQIQDCFCAFQSLPLAPYHCTYAQASETNLYQRSSDKSILFFLIRSAFWLHWRVTDCSLYASLLVDRILLPSRANR